MAYNFNDNVCTKSFTPREYQVELLDNAKDRNIIICLGTGPAKIFITSKLIVESAIEVRKNEKCTIYLAHNDNVVSFMATYLEYLTDLSVQSFFEWNPKKFQELRSNKQVLVMTPDICVNAVNEGLVNLSCVNLLIIDQCQLVVNVNHPLQQLMKIYGSLNGCKPRLLGLTPSLFSAGCDSSRLEWALNQLESALHSSVETASEIVSLLRFSTHPTERILECAVHEPGDIDNSIFQQIEEALTFLNDHRYDPFEIYDEEYREDLQGIPDPKIDPLNIMNDFLDILRTLGPYCADRAALIYLVQIEKLKIKTPYERHYLLLCMVSSVMIKIRAICEYEFQKYDDKEKIYKFCSPKVLRLLEILKQFKPVQTESEEPAEGTSLKSNVSKAIEGKPTDEKGLANAQDLSSPTETSAGEKAALTDDLSKPLEAAKDEQGEISIPPKQPLKAVGRSSRGRGRGRAGRYQRKGNADGPRRGPFDPLDPDILCGVIFVRSHLTAKILFYLLNEVRRHDEKLNYLGVQYTVEKTADPVTEPRDAEQEHRKQEEVLKRFRMHECNLLIATSVLEEGIELPRCNLVVRFDEPQSYRSYVHCKGRARAADAHFILLIEKRHSSAFIRQLAEYLNIEQVLLKKCANREGSEEEEREADLYNCFVKPYSPTGSTDKSSCASLSNAIALVNRYCAKLPSDTFTKLTPSYSMQQSVADDGTKLYSCSLRLPINSPVKQNIKGPSVPNPILAQRLTALETVRILHCSQELDDSLMPIGKESFRLTNDEANGGIILEPDEIEEASIPWESNEPRPGTTKRRQYYYKRVAEALTDCRPVAGSKALLYHVSMVLTCPLPDEQNTRGRSLYAPEDSAQGFGILTLKPIPKVCPFPIFTRSGEVSISLELNPEPVKLTDTHVEKIVTFLNYTFTNVLRLQKYLMMFDPHAAENSYFIVPTRKERQDSAAVVDWEFLDCIYDRRNLSPKPVAECERKDFKFDACKYQDAVVMPWYRNQDQPQYFYVAEICYQLTPKSSFPSSENYKSFEDYYFKKYGLNIQNREQPLLDVDHTSARLNFLTPRYVNRKGVALPTSSEETKRAKRENLEQKQILVPELCTVHPFPASLWRKAVCLPCILYRINALLLADQLRCVVASSIGLGSLELPRDFQWKPLNFGWTLSDVLKRSREVKAKEESLKDKDTDTDNSQECPAKPLPGAETTNEKLPNPEKEPSEGTEERKKTDSPWIDIGTWSNEMAANPSPDPDIDFFDPNAALPGNVTMVPNMPDMGGGWGSGSGPAAGSAAPGTGWGSSTCHQEGNSPAGGGRGCSGTRPSPSPWGGLQSSRTSSAVFQPEPCAAPDSDSYSDLTDDDDDEEEDSGSDCGPSAGGLRIEYKPDNTAEAVEDAGKEGGSRLSAFQAPDEPSWDWYRNRETDRQEVCVGFEENIERNSQVIQTDGRLILSDKPYILVRASSDQTAIVHSEAGETKLRALKYISEFNNNGSDNKSENKGGSSVVAQRPQQCSPPLEDGDLGIKFSFDAQPELDGHPGPSPAIILQALTMSNANDGINLERLETIGDSFLKYAITTYLYCTFDCIHEGKLSHLRSKQVSNLNLYRLGRRKVFGESMIATKFEPHDNWLPPCYYVPRDLEKALIQAGLPACHWNSADLPSLRNLTLEEIQEKVNERKETLKLANISAETDSDDDDVPLSAALQHKKLVQFQQQQQLKLLQQQKEIEKNLRIKEGEGCEEQPETITDDPSADTDPLALLGSMPCFIPYNLITQHSIPDKSIADCVEALIGAYLISCGPRGALLFMAWLGIKVLPEEEVAAGDGSVKVQYGFLQPPNSPLLRHVANPEGQLEVMLDGFEKFEQKIHYRFADRSYLLQALTHASYSPNQLTDCYQRLEFLGDAVLDYLITRHLYEDWRQHSPGALTDLRSALVNNTIFASLAVKFGFHQYFRHLSPGLNEVIDRFVRIQEENGHAISEEYYLIEEEECEEAEDVEVPKALGDVFESVAGAIFLDSGMSLDAVWRVYYRMMRPEIEQFSTNVPKSPIRELLEMEPETAKFGKPEKLADGRRVRVTVEVFSKGTFKGIGRNYRIAKCTAAKCALKQLKKREMMRSK
ncbi:Endoribonuclease Dcr-1 [Frankliniella fusca]|uniref:ribonuclease III n=1 Tax=Frankliniella fusca TaxID=407009 RepID=A0AAE1LTS6_9NEOP|nr:Endoribonuclease Dcr-1 [Frankliniella fusca]